MTTSVKEAKDQVIYFIESIGSNSQEPYTIGTKTFFRNVFNLKKFQIEKTNLYDFVMKSAEETTSPRGVENKLHIREKERECSCVNDDGDFDPDCKKCYQGSKTVYQVWNWGFRGQYPSKIDEFDTEEEAEDFIFDRTYEYDFMRDDQRDTCYYDSEEEAKEEIIRRYAELWSVKENTATSIVNHMELADNIRSEREAIYAKELVDYNKAERERIDVIASEYSKMIEKIDGESYKETAARLSAAIGERIESKVFHVAVKMIRK